MLGSNIGQGNCAKKIVILKPKVIMVTEVLVNFYHNFARTKISLTTKPEIDKFNLLINSLATFCDPSKTNDINPEVSACWNIFTYTQKNATTYEFARPSQFIESQAVGGKVHWDYPFTKNALDFVAQAPCMQNGSKQNLVRLVFGYITSVILAISTFKIDDERYDSILHLNCVINLLRNDDSCRRLFDGENIHSLEKIENRITQFFSLKRAKEGSESIFTAVASLELILREISSQLFQVLLVATEGSNKQKITHDYGRIILGEITDEAKPKAFSASNPFKNFLQTSAAILNPFSNESHANDAISKLVKPEVICVKSFIEASSKDAVEYHKSWFGEHKHGLMYLFMQSIDLKTKTVGWVTSKDENALDLSSQELMNVAYWLKYTLTLFLAMQKLNLLLSMNGQKWIAKGIEAEIIQSLINKIHIDLKNLSQDINGLRDFLHGRIGTRRENEHNIMSLVRELDETATRLNTRGVTPLLNIDVKYLMDPEFSELVRYEFFKSISLLINGSHLGFRLPVIAEPKARITYHQMIKTHVDDRRAKGPRADSYTQINLTRLLSNWINGAFGTKNDEEFLRFWKKLLYVEKDHGLLKGSKLPQLFEFHGHYQHDVKKLQQQHIMNEDLKITLHAKGISLARWAEDVVVTLYKSQIGSVQKDAFLEKKLSILKKDIDCAQEASAVHLQHKLKIDPEVATAWDKATHTELTEILVKRFMMSEPQANKLLIDISLQLLQRNKEPDNALSEALDSLLITTLNQVVINADVKKNKDYWNDMCRGLMMLGASPLSWMDHHMEQKALVTEVESHGFFVAARQSTSVISSITYRAKLLGESTAHLKETLDILLSAVEKFGERLYSCVGDDTTWWWVPLETIGFKHSGGARLERATLFWAAIRWIDVSLNEQLLEEGAARLQSSASVQALKHLDDASRAYRVAVPEKDRCLNQGFESWRALDTALKNFIVSMDVMALLRCQRQMAKKLDERLVKQSGVAEAISKQDKIRNENTNLVVALKKGVNTIETLKNDKTKMMERILVKEITQILPDNPQGLTHDKMNAILVKMARDITEEFMRDDPNVSDPSLVFERKTRDTLHLIYSLVAKNNEFSVLRAYCPVKSSVSTVRQSMFNGKSEERDDDETSHLLSRAA